VFDVQRFSVHDGPGIRTTVFFQGCPLRCGWCQNPESFAAGQRLMLYRDLCMGCDACRRVCPRGLAGPLSGDGLHDQDCERCGRCAAACPTAARRTAGRETGVEEILERVLLDRPFYGEEGGVTLGGGEPLSQWRFVGELAERLRGLGVHVALDTSGAAPREVVEEVPGRVDLVIADLKLVTPDRHRQWTGQDNAGIVAAIRYWDREMPGRLWVSVPVVPEVQEEAEIEKIAAFLSGLENGPPVRLIPFSRFGESKHEALGREGRVFAGEVENLVEKAREVFADRGLRLVEQ